jgi:hypothetical protein
MSTRHPRRFPPQLAKNPVVTTFLPKTGRLISRFQGLSAEAVPRPSSDLCRHPNAFKI